MDLKLSQCFIAVDDHDNALAFYRDVLGLEVRNDVRFEGMRGVTVGAPEQADVGIVLEPPVADPNASAADKDAAAQLLAKGLLRGVIFETDDCDGTFERIRAAGGEVLQEPMDMPYGVRDCAFRDPSGNMLRFSQPGGGDAVTPVRHRRGAAPRVVADGGGAEASTRGNRA
jgi:predicted enzyme related to lactoylglutathione lyase